MSKEHIPWGKPSLVVALLQAVKVHQAHIPKHGEKEKRWIQVNKTFFSDELIAGDKSKYNFDESNYRRLEDKFKAEIKEAREMFGMDGKPANLSKFGGDIDGKYEILKELIEDMDELVEKKEGAKKLQAKLETNETTVLQKFITKEKPTSSRPTKDLDNTEICSIGKPPKVPRTERTAELVSEYMVTSLKVLQTMHNGGICSNYDDYNEDLSSAANFAKPTSIQQHNCNSRDQKTQNQFWLMYSSSMFGGIWTLKYKAV